MAEIQNPGKLMSQLVAPSFLTAAKDIRPRLMRVNFKTLERMSDRNSLVNAIINKRCEQIRVFCKVARERNERGFQILPKEKRGGKRRIRELENFFLQTGFGYDVDREDDLTDFVQYLVRDAMVFDQNATEMRRTRNGKVFDFWYVDPTTILRALPKGGEMRPSTLGAPPPTIPTSSINQASNIRNPKVRFVQRDIHGRIIAQYTPEQMVFDYMHKRSQMLHRGYGYSFLQQSIDVITTFLFAVTYNRDLFIRERLPKGFLAVTGDVNSSALTAIRNHWVNEMTGYGAKFRVPILPSGKDGVGIDWKSLGQTNRDMEYMRLFHLVISLICAVFTIDPAELGIKTERSQAVIGESGDKRIQESKDTGLGSILAYVETYLNKILQKVDADYVLKFVGIKNEDEKLRAEVRKARLETDTTVDELREEEGLEPFNEPWSQVPANPHLLQMIQAQQMAAAGGEAGPEGIGEVPPEEEETPPEEEEGGGVAFEVEEGEAEEERPMRRSKAGIENEYFTIEV